MVMNLSPPFIFRTVFCGHLRLLCHITPTDIARPFVFVKTLTPFTFLQP